MITNKEVFRSIEKKAKQLRLVPDQLQVEQLQNVFLFKEYTRRNTSVCIHVIIKFILFLKHLEKVK